MHSEFIKNKLEIIPYNLSSFNMKKLMFSRSIVTKKILHIFVRDFSLKFIQIQNISFFTFTSKKEKQDIVFFFDGTLK